MLKNLSWLVPDRVLYWQLASSCTVAEFQVGLEEVQDVLKAVSSKVHLIIDARSAQSLDGNTTSARKIAQSLARNTQMGCCMVISHNFFFKHQLNRVTIDFGTDLRYSDSYRHAWKSLHNLDTGLPYVAPTLPTSKPSRTRKNAF
ncbi:MAG: hypothetical protein WBC91_14015 [Phototrophicaceae bacterium]